MQYLRAAFARSSNGHIDSKAVEQALSRTEQGLQVACEKVEHSSNNNVVTLPSVKRDSPTKPLGPSQASGTNKARGVNQRKSMKEVVSIARKRSPIKQANKQPQPSIPVVAPNSLSPGQQAQAQHVSHLVSNPTHLLTQQILASHYGLPLSSAAVMGGGGGGRKELAGARLIHHQGQIFTGPTTAHLTTLPRANRRDAQVHALAPL